MRGQVAVAAMESGEARGHGQRTLGCLLGWLRELGREASSFLFPFSVFHFFSFV